MPTDQKQIFSQEALDKLRSPEKLDTMLPITTPITWMALIAVLILLFSVAVWSVYGSFTVKTEGMGLITTSAGVVNISHMKNGKITRLYVRAGKSIQKGDLIAKMQEERQTVEEDIYSDYDGVVAEVLVDEDSMLSAGAPICSVRIAQGSEDLTGFLYIPIDKGKRVCRGMSIHLATNGVDVSESGNLLGVVREVSQYPATLQEIQRHLGNAQLAQWILQTQNSPVMEVKFDLVKKPNSDSEYMWTSQTVKHEPVTAGSFCTGSIIIERQPPLEKIFHRFSQWLRSS